MKIDPYKFFNLGYSEMTMPPDLVKHLWHIIYSTKWVTNTLFEDEESPDWIVPEELGEHNNWLGYPLMTRKMRYRAPLELKEFAQKVLHTGVFDPLLAPLTSSWSKDKQWVNNIEPSTFFIRKNTTEIDWHTDFSGPEDFFILLYLNEDYEPGKTEGGHIHFGIADETGTVKEVGKMFPETGSAVVVNCMNPYFKHKVDKNYGYTRYVLNIAFKINPFC